MAQNHEDGAAELHATLQERIGPIGDRKRSADMAGGDLPVDEKGVVTDLEDHETAEGEEPNEREKKTLRRIGDAFPKSAYLIALVELCERFTCESHELVDECLELTWTVDYGCQGLFQNYIAQSPDGFDGARGLGLGHAGATGLNVFFQFFCYITPILGAIISDQYLGKYKTILIFAGVYWVGLIILWTTALPTAISHGASLGGYVSMSILQASSCRGMDLRGACT